MKHYTMNGEIYYDADVPQDHNERHKVSDQIGRDHFPELADTMDVRNVLMDAAKKMPGYKHEGSGAGFGGADFSFFMNGKLYWVKVSNEDEPV